MKTEEDDHDAGCDGERVFVLRRICPISVEIAPNVIKTTLKPAMNPTEFVITRRISRPCDDFNSSTPAPEINETYPGTSGSTQGERKEISPAKNAAIGSGRLDILDP